MPIPDDPNDHGYYILRRHRKLADPLRFKVRCVTIAQSRAIANDFDEALKLKGEEPVRAALLDRIIKPYVVGWNEEAEFSIDALTARIRRDDLIELAMGIDYATAPTEEDRKKSESDVLSAPENSATNAEQTA